MEKISKLGGYEFEEFETAKLKQRPASAWSAFEVVQDKFQVIFG